MQQTKYKENEGTAVLTGEDFREMFSFATEWLAKSESDVNTLNVFPVPDGDTGTNMVLTMRSCIDEASQCADQSIKAVVKVMAHGALMGARGNSGVILSQIWRGIAQGLQEKETAGVKDLAEAFRNAAKTAYEGLDNPVEGTMLTVMKDTAAAGATHLDDEGDNVEMFLQSAVEAAGQSVANTPNLLPVLKEAGVVDSGGQGLYILLEGALMYLRGQTLELESGKSKIITTAQTTESPELSGLKDEVPFGYCTEFLVKGKDLVPDRIRKRLQSKGLSLVVVGDESTVKIHIHAADPGPVIHYAVSLGTISAVHIRNMDEQYEDLLKIRKETKSTTAKVAVVTVASGEGFVEILHKLGAAVVPGGQTMNPSAKEILQAIEAIPSDKIIILPNDKNLVLVAQQLKGLTNKEVRVIPTMTIPQGIAALLSFDPGTDLESNIDLMTESKSMVRTIEVTHATRSTRVNGFSIRKNQMIGLLDGKLLATGNTADKVFEDILGKIDLNDYETASIYYGNGTNKEDAEKIKDLIYCKNPKLNIETARGGQPLYSYVVSIE